MFQVTQHSLTGLMVLITLCLQVLQKRESSVVLSNIVNIKTVAPLIAKVIDSTSEPDSPSNNVMIEEVVVYRLNLTIPEGSTLNVSLRDILPSIWCIILELLGL